MTNGKIKGIRPRKVFPYNVNNRKCVAKQSDHIDCFAAFCYGNEEDGGHACMNRHLTTANQLIKLALQVLSAWLSNQTTIKEKEDTKDEKPYSN